VDEPNAPDGPRTDFRISAITKKGALGLALRVAGPRLDRMLGIRKLRLLFERKGFRGLEKRAFLTHFIKTLGIDSDLPPGDLTRFPATGPCIVVANHPLGGLEGIILAEILGRARPDLKIIGNLMLSFVRELSDYFILVNNMVSGHKRNVRSLAEASRWIREGHCLVVFPAGRVGLYRPDKGYVTDEPGDRIALSLSLTTGAPVVPVFIGASSSRLFSFLCRFIYPMKLLLLVREFMDSFGKTVAFRIGNPIPTSRFEGMPRASANAYLRMRVYLLADPAGRADPDARAHSSARAEAAAALIALVAGRAEGAGGSGRSRPKKKRKRLYEAALHPEVEDYVDLHGLDPEELADLVHELDRGAPDSRSEAGRPAVQRRT